MASKSKREIQNDKAKEAVENALTECLRGGYFVTGNMVRCVRNLLEYEICQDRLAVRHKRELSRKKR